MSPNGESALYNAESYAFIGAQKCTNTIIMKARTRVMGEITTDTSSGSPAETKQLAPNLARAQNCWGSG
ncbi:MAG: hypothetical protein ACFFCJ_10910, partial [Promethearchaeota archaeon]